MLCTLAQRSVATGPAVAKWSVAGATREHPESATYTAGPGIRYVESGLSYTSNTMPGLVRALSLRSQQQPKQRKTHVSGVYAPGNATSPEVGSAFPVPVTSIWIQDG